MRGLDSGKRIGGAHRGGGRLQFDGMGEKGGRKGG